MESMIHKRYKARTDLRNNSPLQIYTKANVVLKRMTDNPNFPNPTPTMPEFALTVDKLKQSLIACKGTKLGYRNRDTAVRELTLMYRRLALYVDVTSGGDASIIQTSGYAVNREKSNIYITEAPVMKHPKKIEQYGQVKIRWIPIANATMYIIRVYELDQPGKVIGHYESAKSSFILRGLESGKKYVVRVRVRSRRGEGPMSNDTFIWENWL